MGFSLDNGYTPATIEALMTQAMNGVNTQFSTTYTYETFVGTNFYKYFYALIQVAQANEIKTSEIFLKLQDYFATTNEVIARPVVTAPGLVAKFLAEGYTASVKAPIDADAGKIYICVNLDSGDADYATDKAACAAIIRDSVVAGVVSQGAVSTTLVLTNGQSFDFKFKLPTLKPALLRLTIVTSTNNQVVIDDPDTIKQRLLDNIDAKYSLGRNFEPQRYFSTADAPWAASTLLEYSLNAGSSWSSAVYTAAYDDLFVYPLEDVLLVES